MRNMKHSLERKIAAVLAFAAGLSLLGGCGKKNVELASGELENSPYPCTWAEQKDGSYDIAFAGDLPADAAWTVMATTGVIEAKEKGSGAGFTVKPVGPGSGTLVLRMREKDLPVDKGADFSFGFSVEDSKKMSLTYSRASEVNAASAAIGSGREIYWKEGSSGSMFIYLPGSGWAVSSNEGVGYLGPTATADGARLEVYTNDKAKSGTLLLNDRESGESVLFTFSVSEGKLTAAKCEEVKDEPAEAASEEVPEQPEELQELIDAYKAAKTDAEREEIKAQYDAAKKRLEKEAELQAAIDMFTEQFGRELTKKELQLLTDSYLGED